MAYKKGDVTIAFDLQKEVADALDSQINDRKQKKKSTLEAAIRLWTCFPADLQAILMEARMPEDMIHCILLRFQGFNHSKIRKISPEKMTELEETARKLASQTGQKHRVKGSRSAG